MIILWHVVMNWCNIFQFKLLDSTAHIIVHVFQVSNDVKVSHAKVTEQSLWPPMDIQIFSGAELSETFYFAAGLVYYAGYKLSEG